MGLRLWMVSAYRTWRWTRRGGLKMQPQGQLMLYAQRDSTRQTDKEASLQNAPQPMAAQRHRQTAGRRDVPAPALSTTQCPGRSLTRALATSCARGPPAACVRGGRRDRGCDCRRPGRSFLAQRLGRHNSPPAEGGGVAAAAAGQSGLLKYARQNAHAGEGDAQAVAAMRWEGWWRNGRVGDEDKWELGPAVPSPDAAPADWSAASLLLSPEALLLCDCSTVRIRDSSCIDMADARSLLRQQRAARQQAQRAPNPSAPTSKKRKAAKTDHARRSGSRPAVLSGHRRKCSPSARWAAARTARL